MKKLGNNQMVTSQRLKLDENIETRLNDEKQRQQKKHEKYIVRINKA